MRLSPPGSPRVTGVEQHQDASGNRRQGILELRGDNSGGEQVLGIAINRHQMKSASFVARAVAGEEKDGHIALRHIATQPGHPTQNLPPRCFLVGQQLDVDFSEQRFANFLEGGRDAFGIVGCVVQSERAGVGLNSDCQDVQIGQTYLLGLRSWRTHLDFKRGRESFADRRLGLNDQRVSARRKVDRPLAAVPIPRTFVPRHHADAFQSLVGTAIEQQAKGRDRMFAAAPRDGPNRYLCLIGLERTRGWLRDVDQRW